MQVTLNREQIRALQALKEGMEHMRGYRPTVGDDTPVFAIRDNAYDVLLEFATEDGRLQVGHFNDIVSILENANGE